MRVIAGRAKGRRLDSPTWDGLRPTSDRLRESLFNILAPRIEGARVLDGYAGTGAVGIEALSRGAAHVTFIEKDDRALKLIRANLERAGMKPGENACTIIRAGFLEGAGAWRNEPFDLVIIDPPYDDPALPEALGAAGGVLSDDGLVVLEHATRIAPPEPAGGLLRVRTVKAGDSSLSFYEKRNG
ncbi:MAG: 16S rRNA (guanine(966)-N(2))-methyltransferase RsmD [Acidobacteriota bacterium]|nr:16S rRNA (guanine(966)-N(2))-methyltransferase RsmD [Acidobacteriota bacterium]